MTPHTPTHDHPPAGTGTDLSGAVAALLAGAAAGGGVSAFVIWAPALWDTLSRHRTLDNAINWLSLYAASMALAGTLFLVALVVMGGLLRWLAPAFRIPGVIASAGLGAVIAGVVSILPWLAAGNLANTNWLYVGAAIAGGVAAGATIGRARARAG